MGSEWESVRLVDITSKLGDGLHGTPKYSPDGDYYFINGNNLLNGVIAFDEKTKRVDHSEFLKYQKELNSRTILVSINGTIGNIAFYNGEKVVLGKSACYFNIVDSVDKEFIRYILAGHGFQSYIEAFATGTTIKNVSLKTMREFEFKLPEIQEQKRIAHILSSLDNKITLNRHLNQTLEQMAQALFKSWFVDFDPVIDNALAAGNPIPEDLQDRAERRQLQLAKADHKPLPESIRKLFPSEFALTESLGWVPKGWEVSTLEKLAEKITDGAHQSPPSVDPLDGLPMASSKDLTIDGIEFDSCRYISKHDFKDLVNNGCAPITGDILIAKDGARCGETCCIHNSDRDVVLLSSVAIIRPKYPELRTYINTLLTRNETITELRENYISGSAIPRIVLKDFKRFPVIKATNTVFESWASQTNLIQRKRDSNTDEIRSLVNLRDTLLPKLISGELRIPEAQAQLEEALA